MSQQTEQTELSFKEITSFEKRVSESSRIRAKFPDRAPMIIERAPGAHVPLIDKNKFLVPLDLTFGQLLYIIRRRLILPPEQALFVFCGKLLPSTATLIREVYNRHKDSDGFVYLRYTGENTYGQ